MLNFHPPAPVSPHGSPGQRGGGGHGLAVAQRGGHGDAGPGGALAEYGHIELYRTIDNS